MTDLLALGIEQEGAHRRRSHIRPGCGPDHGWGDGGYACLWEGKERKESYLCTRDPPKLVLHGTYFLVAKVFFLRFLFKFLPFTQEIKTAIL